MKQASPPHTAFYLLQSVDRDFDEDENIVRVDEHRAIHVDILWRTVFFSVNVTILCLLLGYPIAYLLAILPTRQSNLLILLLPFWTSLLVRTTAWLVLLQNEGLVNDLAITAGAWEEPVQLVRNRLGVYVAMVHILLPFMVLPMFSAMKGIDPYHMCPAASLGAHPLRAFLRVYLPQTIPGVGARVLLVFILSLGYYITPALVGGPRDQMLSYFIAFHANTTVNWGRRAPRGKPAHVAAVSVHENFLAHSPRPGLLNPLYEAASMATPVTIPSSSIPIASAVPSVRMTSSGAMNARWSVTM